ncbi:MAG TPA: hypothetical protein VJ932_04180 [Alkalispirochaeta sp.]|nr:hypothetical protein [Alkalispirochaeta sp.]
MSAMYEFYAPFAHIPGRYEVARIHSPTHGSFDTVIVITTTTDAPVVVYVNSTAGERFMADRYPESTAIRVPSEALTLEGDPWSPVVGGRLISDEGPVHRMNLRFSITDDQVLPRAAPYGGENFSVWGSSFTCSGVDLEVPAAVSGEVESRQGHTERWRAEPAIVTRGSFGAIVPRE